MKTETENMFTSTFNPYCCVGDTIEAEIDGFSIVARIVEDNHHIDNDDCHSVDQSVTGCTDEQYKDLLSARQAWFAGEWFYCGVVLSVSCNDIMLDKHAASLWGIECDYPGGTNDYLTEVANELLNEALETGKAIMLKLSNYPNK